MTSAFDRVPWTVRRAAITDHAGETVFEEDVEAPESWSDSAVGIVASRYFNGSHGAPGRESSVRQLLTRVVDTLAGWVVEEGLGDDRYEDELRELLLLQRGAFNSPVWFNAGVDEQPQCSACFILSVEDSLRSILELARVEGLIFQRGSGAGSNLSTLRSSRELLATGGRASGPVSFMRGYDAFAGVVKSGGRTRRAAKMQILEATHPDVLNFAAAKQLEERKAKALMAAGFTGGLDGEAHQSVAFQNSNLSVRVTDAFMEAVLSGSDWTTRAVTTGEELGRFPARMLLRRVAESAWECGDPGLQYEGAIARGNPCANSGRIRASNPCSEFLFLDDTACNLASLNLLRFLHDDGGFDVDAFTRDIGTLLRAMEAIVDRSSYPTERITRNSRRFRPLGLGYANLGATLMAQGLPYDSARARGFGAAVTALMTGEAYRVSASMAAQLGPFDGFSENREPFLDVLERHSASLDAITDAPSAILTAAAVAWDDALRLAREHGVRNAQVSVLAPTGTIAFLMDCDTTGIEPDLSLVKYKLLSGGGTLKLVNRAIDRALRTLGYTPPEADRILAWVRQHETIEGAPGLIDEHLAVFDCAVSAPGGERLIAPEGHLAMMAAVQPFLSGGISKTLNLAEDTTVAGIEELFVRAWKLGLKSLAVFRENSKGIQPLGSRCVIGGGCCD